MSWTHRLWKETLCTQSAHNAMSSVNNSSKFCQKRTASMSSATPKPSRSLYLCTSRIIGNRMLSLSRFTSASLELKFSTSLWHSSFSLGCETLSMSLLRYAFEFFKTLHVERRNWHRSWMWPLRIANTSVYTFGESCSKCCHAPSSGCSSIITTRPVGSRSLRCFFTVRLA